jgi:hypothetical protein
MTFRSSRLALKLFIVSNFFFIAPVFGSDKLEGAFEVSRELLGSFNNRGECPALFFAVALKHDIYRPYDRGAQFADGCGLRVKGFLLDFVDKTAVGKRYSLVFDDSTPLYLEVNLRDSTISYEYALSGYGGAVVERFLNIAGKKLYNFSGAYSDVGRELSEAIIEETNDGSETSSAMLERLKSEIINIQSKSIIEYRTSGQTQAKYLAARPSAELFDEGASLLNSLKFSVVVDDIIKASLALLLLIFFVRKSVGPR